MGIRQLSIFFLVISCVSGISAQIEYNDGGMEPTYIQDTKKTIMCFNKVVNDTYGLVYSHEMVEKEPYSADTDCLLTINAAPGSRINLRFEYVDMERNFNQALNRCRTDGDRFEIFESNNQFWIKNLQLLPDRTVCGGSGLFPDDYQSAGSVVTLRLVTDSEVTENKGVQLLYTSFLPPGEKSDACFMCDDNSMCIDKSLKCNGVPNCNDNSDEYGAMCSSFDAKVEKILDELQLSGTVVALIGSAIIILIIILLILCICCCCYCCSSKKKTTRDGKQYIAPPVPRPTAYPPQQNSTPTNYSSYNSKMTNHHRPNHSLNYPPGYPPMQNGGYSVAYNHENGRMQFPHQV